MLVRTKRRTSGVISCFIITDNHREQCRGMSPCLSCREVPSIEPGAAFCQRKRGLLLRQNCFFAALSLAKCWLSDGRYDCPIRIAYPHACHQVRDFISLEGHRFDYFIAFVQRRLLLIDFGGHHAHGALCAGARSSCDRTAEKKRERHQYRRPVRRAGVATPMAMRGAGNAVECRSADAAGSVRVAKPAAPATLGCRGDGGRCMRERASAPVVNRAQSPRRFAGAGGVAQPMASQQRTGPPRRRRVHRHCPARSRWTLERD